MTELLMLQKSTNYYYKKLPKLEYGLDIFVKYEDDYRAGTISTGLEAAYT